MILLGSKGLLNDVSKNLALSDWCGALPYKWNKKKSKLEEKSSGKLVIYKVHLFLSFIYIVCTFVQAFLNWKGAPLMVITHNVMFLTTGIVCIATHFVNIHDIKRVTDLFNSFIDYENRQSVERGFHTHTKNMSSFGIKYLLLLLSTTGIFMPIIYHLDVLRNPCFRLYVGYWLSDQCQPGALGVALEPKWTLVEMITKLGISSVSYFVWSFLLVGFCCESGLQLVLHGHCLRCYIKDFGFEMMKASKTTALTESTLSAYRELQLLCLEYRMCFSKYMLATITSCMLVISTICLYTDIQMFSGQDTTGGSLQYNLLYMWTGFAGLLDIIYINGILADVYKVYKRAQDDLNGNAGLKKSKWFRRWMRSCPILRIYFGGTNYYDELTPLNLLDFVIDQTVSLLLLKN